MICPICKAYLEYFDDTRYCSNCGNYIYNYQSIIRNNNSFSNRTYDSLLNQPNTRNRNLRNQNTNTQEKKKDFDYVPLIIVILVPIILFLLRN